jgi:DNA polymerase-3 subunit alpha
LVLVEGQLRFDETGDAWRLSARRISELDRAREQQAQRIVLLWPRAPGADHRLLLQRLAEVLGPHRPGPCAVGVRYSGEQAGVSLELGDEWRVRANPVLLEALEQLVGTEGLRVAYGPPAGTAGSAYGVV